MALTLVLSAIASIVLYHVFRAYRSLQRNIQLAKSSGLPVVVTPCNVFSVFWLATYYLWIPLLRKLPASCKGIWLDLMDPEWSYRLGHWPFEQLGSDVFIVASPTKLTAFVADAEVVTQITTRRNDFPKPLELYHRLDIYGKNLVSTEGSDWRMHRKLTAPSFGEKNNELVFIETLHNTQSLLRLWTGPEGIESKTLKDAATDTMRWALYIISGAGFNLRVKWPHEEEEEPKVVEAEDSVFMSSQVPPGHKMTYREALSELLHNIMWTMIGPPEYLTKSPFKIHRTVGTAVIEWGKYMDEIFQFKKDQVASGHNSEGIDLFQALIRNSGILDEKESKIQKSDILGNTFVLMLAGHETTANALHFSLIFLAMYWSSQKRLQEDIDEIINGRPIKDWRYEEDFPKLFNSMPAAVMNEVLRVMSPIVNIPKSTAPERPQQFSMDGQQYTMPGDTHIWLSAAVHRNPKYWPPPSNGEDQRDPRGDPYGFRPERWLVDTKSAENFVDINYDDEELRGPSGEDTSSQLFKPARGSYIPFSEGYRSCIGRRFAQVEILTALAVIFTQFSVELAVDEWASDSDIEQMPADGKERREIWQKAADRADYLLRTKTESVITLQLRGHGIPIRLVRRGEERFIFDSRGA